MSNDGAATRDGVVQSVDRAVAVLEILGREGWVGVTSVARELRIHKSTAFRLLSTLERRGMVEQHGETQKYRLGLAIVRLAGAVRSNLDLTRLARPVSERLSSVTGETVTLAVLEGDAVLYIDQVSVSPSVVGVNWLGRKAPLHTTSDGKVFLAELPERVREEFLADGLATVTSHTVTDPQTLRAQLAEVGRAGYGCTLQELELGLNAVASPIRGVDGSVLASICVSGPSYRLRPDRIAEFGRLTADAARDVSRRLGFSGRPAPRLSGAGA